jgi:predicted RNA-binding protein YlqC (UPF0109 family)
MDTESLQPPERNMHARIRDLALAAAEPLVKYPDLLKVTVSPGVRTIHVELCGHATDTGALLGMDCRHALAIETLLRIQDGERQVKVRIGEGYVGAKEPRVNVPLTDAWLPSNDIALNDIVARVLTLTTGTSVQRIQTESFGQNTIVKAEMRGSHNLEIQDALSAIVRPWGRVRGRKVSVELINGPLV